MGLQKQRLSAKITSKNGELAFDIHVFFITAV